LELGLASSIVKFRGQSLKESLEINGERLGAFEAKEKFVCWLLGVMVELAIGRRKKRYIYPHPPS
jgi:hypothetical protein